MDDISGRRLIIGDVHGHYQGLRQLIDLLDLQPHDQVFFLGDLIDRGPNSAQVVEFVRQQGYPCLMGNHEQMMLLAFLNAELDQGLMHGWMMAGGRSTLDSYENPEQLQSDLDWFAKLPTYLDLGDLWLVHAGVHPSVPLEAQSSQEFCWIRREFHEMTKPFFPDKLIVTGHTITFTFPDVVPGQLVQGAGWLDIDTGAYHPKSGWMTALDFTEKQVYQVNVFDQQSRVRTLADSVTTLAPGTAGQRAQLWRRSQAVLNTLLK